MSSLFERLGSESGIQAIANDLVDLHAQNPLISARFAGSDLSALKEAAATFFIAGTGGPDVYRGEDMLAAHRGMNISDAEFVAVLDDALEALARNGVGRREQEEALFILYSLKDSVVHV